MLAAVMIELEDVIVETRALRAEALRRSMGELGVSLDEKSLARDFTGLAPRERAIRLLGARCAFADETELDLLALRAERAFTESVASGVTLAEGARECIAALQGEARLALVTRASRRVVEAALGLGGLEDAFECIITSDDVRESKPFPVMYEMALARFARRQSVAAAACLALEDGTAGIRAAKRAGMRCIAVGAIPPGEAMEAGADAWLPSLHRQTARTLLALLRRGEESRS
jgi:HAD superfamily hydrolase (TIGR01509 family)